jgi:hypothetical protein
MRNSIKATWDFALASITSGGSTDSEWSSRNRLPSKGEADIVRTNILRGVRHSESSVAIVVDLGSNIGSIWTLDSNIQVSNSSVTCVEGEGDWHGGQDAMGTDTITCDADFAGIELRQNVRLEGRPRDGLTCVVNIHPERSLSFREVSHVVGPVSSGLHLRRTLGSQLVRGGYLKRCVSSLGGIHCEHGWLALAYALRLNARAVAADFVGVNFINNLDFEWRSYTEANI